MIGNSHEIIYDKERTLKYRQGQLCSTDFGSWNAYFRYRQFCFEKEEKEETVEQKRITDLNRRKLHQENIQKEKKFDEEFDSKPKRKRKRRRKNRRRRREKDKRDREDVYNEAQSTKNKN